MKTGAPSSLSIDMIRSALRTHSIGSHLELLDEVDSTNRRALALAEQRMPYGTVVVADAQTHGRGRLGRRWFSPPGVNLYVSILLQRTVFAEILTWIPLVTSLAVHRAVHDVTGLCTKLKWPNDVMADRNGSRRKLAGVLAESSDQALVVGIGVNVNMPVEAFPAELRFCATSLMLETGRPVDRLALLTAVLGNAERLYEELLHSPDQTTAAYRAACDTCGQQVRVEVTGQRSVAGFAEAIGSDGALGLRTTDGRLIELRAGDVIQLR
jgi:BirA family transcriptional regulator, biotin operon repressor / biotin---[acetyl-CoA-carboxylase] ligase